MAVKSIITDGHGTGRTLKLEEEGQAGVVVHPHPPRGEKSAAIPFRQYFTDDGTSTGSSDMIVDGSTTNVEFCIGASDETDIYVKTISVRLGDNGARLNLFGALAALANGVELSWITQDVGDVVIQEAIQTNLDFMRLGRGIPPIGSGTDAFRADVSGSGADTYLPIIDMETTFGLPWGLRLRRGTTDKVCFIVKDNLTGLDTFDIIGFGIKF